MTKRNIIKIDEEKCNGCGQCVTACAEGAIQIIDGKARLVSEIYCDGLGDCIGQCPEDALTIEQREANPFDAQAVQQHLADAPSDAEAQSDTEAQQVSTAQAQGQGPALPCGCPGAMAQTLEPEKAREADAENQNMAAEPSQLGNWPVQIALVPTKAPYLQGARLLIAADCVPFALADFHRRLLGGRVLLIGCPKLDDADFYREKLTEIFRDNQIQDVEVAYMEVPCCQGLVYLVSQALEACGKSIPFKTTKVAIKGQILQTQEPKASKVSF
ncbi:hypothetical protein LCGC14_2863060 [marine sediment metagenome]|uniref:4Fe-4S ferredoxin-type domain-containing protein n=1 Tax=marine sediment metagenome TaxID=412755 RepID=A0A0F8YRV1_9ZZZZ